MKNLREYLINFGLYAVVAYAIATLTFLVSKELGTPSVAGACTAGILGGICTTVSHELGRMVAGSPFNSAASNRIIIGIVAAILFGLLGGWQMTL